MRKMDTCNIPEMRVHPDSVERACEDGADRAGKIVCMWMRE